MQIAPIPENENLRLQALYDYQILDTPEEKDFDDIVKLASEICDVPMSLITLIDMDRQWFKAKVGIDGESTTRDEAFCAHAILDNEPLIVEDAKKDARFFDNPNVLGDPHVRFYTGFPLITPKGYKLGTLCVIDSKPRILSDFQKRALKVLTQQVVDKLELRLKMNELKELYKTIDEKNTRLEQLHQSNSRLLSIIGHDLKSPVATAITFLDVFGDDETDKATFKEYIGAAKDNLSKLTFLMENLLQWAVLQFNEVNIRKETLLINQIVEKEVFCFSKDLQEKGLFIDNLIPKDLEVFADCNILKFVFRNLIINAIKFSEKGKIALACKNDGNQQVFSVSDEGIGISPDRITKIFGWNTRQNTRGTAGEAGSGLGLQVVKEMVEKQGGNIWVESDVNRGTTFYFTVPKN